jgi:nucleoside-diphosphate-sugar epimerase
MKAMRILVTGASGFVGGNLARLLRERGHDVVALVRRTSQRKHLEALGVRCVFGDLATGEGFDEALEGVDCVQHLAGVTKAWTEQEYQRGNALGTELLCAAIARQKTPARLVFCSSLAAAGPSRVGQPKAEHENAQPVSMYGRSKLAAEQVVRRYAGRLQAVILRPPIVYGPGDGTNLPPLMAMGRLGVYLKAGLGPKHFSFIHVEDLCEALLLAATKGKTLSAGEPTQGVYFVADPTAYPWEDFCAELSRAMGKRRPAVIPLPELLGYAAGLGSELGGRLVGQVPIMNRDKAREMRCEAWTCDVRRAQDELSFQAGYPLDKGLAHTVAWYRKEAWL